MASTLAHRSIVSIFIVGIVSLLVAPGVAAADYGLTVSPAIQQIALEPNQRTAKFTVTVTNNTARAVRIAVHAQDFTTFTDDGGIRLLDAKADRQNPHALASAIEVLTSQTSIAPSGHATIPVTISDADQLASGGHYAAIVYEVVDPESAGRQNNVSVLPAVTTLIFVSTQGKGTQSLQLVKPVIGSFQMALPDDTSLVFANKGNTQTTVRGLVQLADSNGTVFRQGIINMDSGLILPDAQRLFSVDLSAQKGWPGLLGRYQLSVFYRHDGESTYHVYKQSFMYINPLLVWIVLPLVITITLLVLRRSLRPASARRHPRSGPVA